ncbi:primase-helicase zinc-binding domain-containing protein [Klebsiella pneumoniae]|uniref:primase-helicase zinc-binding domain-containing protein n=1 Tax=Klebsiella pneumoniae TaxID=573 RepID=UPI0038F7D1AF
MKMNVTDTVKQACGHWRILPALGMKVIKNRHQACPVCGGADRFRFDIKRGVAHGSVTSVAPVTA